MPAMQNNQPFKASFNSQPRTAVVVIGTGTAKLQACAGNEPDTGTWVDVASSDTSASTVFSFFCGQNLYYRWVLTGDATVFQGD